VKQVKPATALPWEQDDEAQVCAGNLVVAVSYMRPADVADQNAAYIVHACNAYPKLVAALRAVYDGVPLSRINAGVVLRELGESVSAQENVGAK
jgi:hypothetical protein